MRDFAKVEPLTKPLHLNESSGTFTLYNAPKSEITLSLNRDSFRGVIFCHKIQASTMRRGYIYKILQGSAGALLFLTGLLFLPGLISVFISVPYLPHSGTLTQFILVLYGTGTPSSSSSDEPQPGNDSCKTLDLRQICIGKSGFSRPQFVPHRKCLSQHPRRGRVITESCWDVTCGAAWLFGGERGEMLACVLRCFKLAFESHTIILFKLFLQMSHHYAASVSVSILNEELISDGIELNFTQGPFLIISFKFNGVHTAGSYLIQILLEARSPDTMKSNYMLSVWPLQAVSGTFTISDTIIHGFISRWTDHHMLWL